MHLKNNFEIFQAVMLPTGSLLIILSKWNIKRPYYENGSIDRVSYYYVRKSHENVRFPYFLMRFLNNF